MAEEGTDDPVATAVLDANTAFYSAFSNGDIEAMATLWVRPTPPSARRCCCTTAGPAAAAYQPSAVSVAAQADEHPVVCLHPGWEAVGPAKEDVVESWAR